MEEVRENEYVPLENSSSTFSLDHVRRAIKSRHTRYLQQAEWTSEGEKPIEIPPRVVLEEADFMAKYGQVRR